MNFVHTPAEVNGLQQLDKSLREAAFQAQVSQAMNVSVEQLTTLISVYKI